jgi:ribosome-binding protein aMBF1 (putative translation factor)
MTRGEKELAPDFKQRITSARESKGWDKRELARRMAETLNVIQSSENGKSPTTSVIRKFERILGIELMVELSPDSERQIGGSSGRGLTLGDFLNEARKDLDG